MAVPFLSFINGVWDILSSYTPPFIGDSIRTSIRQYNIDKEVIRISRPDSLNTSIYYGGSNSLAGQPKRILYDQGAISFLFDTTKAQLTGIVSSTRDTISYQYDGQLLKKVTWTGSVRGNVAFSYDNDMHISNEKINGIDSVSYQYDKDGLLKSAGNLNTCTNLINNLLVGDTLNNIVNQYSYNSLGELIGQQTSYGSTALWQTSYVRDSIGRIIIKNENNQSQILKYSYCYDNQGRIVKVLRNDMLVSFYNYDKAGNRISTVTQNDTIIGSYDAQDRILTYGKSSYIFSPGGDLQKRITTADTTVYKYDALGNLVYVNMQNGTRIDYITDGRGHRIAKKINGAIVRRWLYSDNLKIVEELDSLGQKISRFVYALKSNVPEYFIKQGITYRIITDQLGSVRMVVNSTNGVIAQRIDYDEFGNILYDSSPGFQPFGFAGGLYDQDTKLTRFGARDYDPAIGRWTISDKARFKGGQMNFFVYASNDPINGVDPTGLSVELCEARVILGTIATLYAYGELITALMDFDVADLATKSLAAWVASADVQDAANDMAMEAKGATGNSNLIGLQLRKLGLSRTEAIYGQTAIYIVNYSNSPLITGSLLKKATEGGLLGLDILDLGKNLAEEASRIFEMILGPFVMRSDPELPH